MNLTFDCPSCHATGRVDLQSGQSPIACPYCSHVLEPKVGAIEGARLCACVLCNTQDMYLQKDFPHRLGLAIVALGILFSSLAWWRYHYPSALGILLATAALDCCLYYLVGDVTVCYRCLAQYRGFEQNPGHKPFDLAIGERYRQERLRLELLRRTAAGAARDDARREGPSVSADRSDTA